MYSLTARFNQIVFFASWTLVILSLLNQGTAYLWKTGKPTVSLDVAKLDKFFAAKGRTYSGGQYAWDQAEFRLKLQGDFEPLFNWNLKQLFLYVNVHYSDPQTNFQSDSVIFNKIVPRPDTPDKWAQASKINFVNRRADFPLRDVHHQLRNQTVEFQVWVEVMPYVGFIRREQVGAVSFKMPEQYM